MAPRGLECLTTFQKFMVLTVEFLLYIRYGVDSLAVFMDGSLLLLVHFKIRWISCIFG